MDVNYFPGRIRIRDKIFRDQEIRAAFLEIAEGFDASQEISIFFPSRKNIEARFCFTKKSESLKFCPAFWRLRKRLSSGSPPSRFAAAFFWLLRLKARLL